MSNATEANKKRSRRLYEEVFGNGNYGAADELMAVGIINHGAGSPPALGTGGIKQRAALLRTAFPDLRITLNDQFGYDDRVGSRWTGSGTHSRPLHLPIGPATATATSTPFRGIGLCR